MPTQQVTNFLCSFTLAEGQDRDPRGRLWRWEYARHLGIVFVDRNGNSIASYPSSRNPVWQDINKWLDERGYGHA